MISQRLKILREEKGLSKKKLSEYLMIAPSTYGKYELNKREPDTTILAKLADFYDTSVDYILGRTDVRQKDFYLDLNEADYAFFDEIKDLNDEAKQDILDFAKYIRQKKSQKH